MSYLGPGPLKLIEGKIGSRSSVKSEVVPVMETHNFPNIASEIASNIRFFSNVIRTFEQAFCFLI